MFHSQRSAISIEARVSGPVGASSSSVEGGLINLDEAVETPPSPIGGRINVNQEAIHPPSSHSLSGGPMTRAKTKSSSSNSDDILTPNPKKTKIRTLESMTYLRALRPRHSSSEDSANELSRAILVSSIR